MTIRQHSKNIHWRFATTVLSAMSILLLALSTSCSQPQLPPVTPTTPPSQPQPTMPAPASAPVSGWSADGTIATGEYAGENSYGDYEINWRSDDKYVYIGIKAKTSGWVAVAIQPGNRMLNADIILGLVKDDKASVYDQFSTGDYGPHSADTNLGGSNDITEFAGKEEGGYTTIEFKRALNTGDKYDQPLSKGTNKIIWAYGTIDEVTQRHTVRGYGEINL